ncbi:MAG: nucleotidyl transferase AbiEii/AbiGii toxin family protein [Deltaproteobacteria bacterium]|jgi:hypothetical protein|nr:nucleotidyl transferase AbiEii/AbiGii toxin family protein [Deltaproteobacteria bacterium]
MYDVMGALVSLGVPIVYKGAMITKLILQENHFDDFTRETRDIDIHWVESKLPSMEDLKETLNRALARFGLTAVTKRAYGENKAAGFRIFDANGKKKLMIDVNMGSVVDIQRYQFGNVTFQGVTPNSVISDKIKAVSSDKICRRVKDLVDLYALAHCLIIKKSELFKIWKKENLSIGSFKVFTKRHEDLEHAFEKLNRIEAKPSFEEVYGYLTAFLAPFMDPTLKGEVWDSKTRAWGLDQSPNNNCEEKKPLLEAPEAGPNRPKFF